jgi:hypothetical protein
VSISAAEQVGNVKDGIKEKKVRDQFCTLPTIASQRLHVATFISLSENIYKGTIRGEVS